LKYEELISVLKTKWKGKEEHPLTRRDIAKKLGMTGQTLAKWEKSDKDLTPTQVVNILTKANQVAVSNAHLSAVRPIVEIFPITNHKRSAIGEYWDVFDGGKSASGYMQGLKDALQNAHGIYIFYDSRGDALYAGKARKLRIWQEMNNAFNRSRKDVQNVMLVKHPVDSDHFVPSHQSSLQPRSTNQYLYQLASYFSAYQVDDAMIDDVESLLLRAFPNNLLNVRMERFTADRQVRKQKRETRLKLADSA
jgi:hypothetical protein